jgi:hypothetical protein
MVHPPHRGLHATSDAVGPVTVGTYDWRDAPEEWSLQHWLRDNGAKDGEIAPV